MISPLTALELPAGWTAASPGSADVADLHDLLVRHELTARGASYAALEDVEKDVVGAGEAARWHAIVRDEQGQVRGWATVHDRAAGRSIVAVAVDPDLDEAHADPLAQALFGWIADVCVKVGAERGIDMTQIDSGAFAADARQQRWLTKAGFDKVRTWWQMTRPVDPSEAESMTEPGPGVIVRTVGRQADGLPDQDDLIAIHDVLETAFTDHFNYHEETFDEFVSRLREDPGHRWDHWWIAELEDEDGGAPRAAGALVGAVSPGGDSGPDGSYVEYLGVLQTARGRGAAKALLNAVIADAAQRGRDRVGLEVDQDSPTGAADLYTSMGFVTGYVTQSWHRDVPVT